MPLEEMGSLIEDFLEGKGRRPTVDVKLTAGLITKLCLFNIHRDRTIKCQSHHTPLQLRADGTQMPRWRELQSTSSIPKRKEEVVSLRGCRHAGSLRPLCPCGTLF